MFSVFKHTKRFTKLLKRLSFRNMQSAHMSMKNIEVCRIMVPDDANIAGNVHGGTILKMIEEAGVVIATRHCNQGKAGMNQDSSWAALTRVERTDFIQPMFIGEVAKVHAELSYASMHSVEVTVYVWAENLRSGAERLTNKYMELISQRLSDRIKQHTPSNIRNQNFPQREQPPCTSKPQKKSLKHYSAIGQHLLDNQDCAKTYIEESFRIIGRARARLWYVPVTIKPDFELDTVPPIDDLTEEQKEEGEKRYWQQKNARAHRKKTDDSNDLYNLRPQNLLTITGSAEVPLHSVPYSQSTLINLISPSACNQFGFAQGGFAMKMMDNVAGIVAFRHCRTNIVTASVEAVDFRMPVKLGHVMTFTGRLVFTSNRSLEIEVLVDAEDVREGKCFRCVSALFTFVSLGEHKNVIAVPQLVVRTEQEKNRFEEGRVRYELKKQKRLRDTAEKKPKTDQ